ncbi:MAG: LuxR C-terminal-related transcriptional regulator [Rhodospirillaceae bacterium]
MFGSILHAFSVAAMSHHEGHLQVIQTALTSGQFCATAFHTVEDLVTGMKHSPFSCAVIDLLSPGQKDCAVIRLLKTLSHGIPLIIIADRCDVSTAVDFMKAGAADVIVGEVSPTTLSDRISEAIIRTSATGSRGISTPDATRRLASLTPRELSLVQLLVQGYHNKEIATHLGLSCRTVESYRKNAMRKLRAKTICDLVKLTLRLDLTKVNLSRGLSDTS